MLRAQCSAHLNLTCSRGQGPAEIVAEKSGSLNGNGPIDDQNDEGGNLEPNDYLKALNKRLKPWKKKMAKGLELEQRRKSGEVLNDDQLALLKDIERNKLMVDELQKVSNELTKIQKEKDSAEAAAGSAPSESAGKATVQDLLKDPVEEAPASEQPVPSDVADAAPPMPSEAPVPEMPKEPQMAAVLQLYQVLYSEVISDHGLANPLTVCMCSWSIDCQ